MKLLLLGTGGYYPNDQRHTACLMLPEVGVVLDAGTGMFRVAEHLTKEQLATDGLDVFLSHAHLDHVLGLTYLLGTLPEDVQRRTKVHGEEAKLDAVRTHLFSQSLFPIMPAFELVPLAGDVPLKNDGQLTYFPLTHPGGSLGYRLDWPTGSLAYVTDTTASSDAAYIEHIRGVSVLVHEAYFPDGSQEIAHVTGHSCLSEVAKIAAAADVGCLILVHVDPRLRNDADLDLRPAQKIFKNTLLGTDRMEIEF
jgi:ribonuclease Z